MSAFLPYAAAKEGSRAIARSSNFSLSLRIRRRSGSRLQVQRVRFGRRRQRTLDLALLFDRELARSAFAMLIAMSAWIAKMSSRLRGTHPTIVRARLGIDELRRDANIVAGVAHTTLHYGLNVELARNVGKRRLSVGIAQHRRAGDDVQCAELGELIQHLFVYPLREVGVVGIRAQVRERQHGYGVRQQLTRTLARLCGGDCSWCRHMSGPPRWR